MPQRRCVGCGRVAAKSELLRFAIDGGARQRTAVPDPAARMPGRGAYLCIDASTEGPAAACLERARRRGAFSRALRASVSLPTELVESKD